ncbi:MAG: flagellar hook-basal body protein [Armatimonadetes bacterium]|nr:flagellar hook-basal body protein [Armatimonadota bacterium]
MLDGMKYATQGMIQMSQKQDIITNNLANAGTAGFRREALNIASFSEVLDRQMGFNPMNKDGSDFNGYMQVGGGLDTNGMLVNNTMTSYSQGPLKETGNQFDLALDDNGVGFFSVQTPGGTQFTRAGSFKMQDGFLKTADGATLLGHKGPINVGKGVNVEITQDGAVKVDGQEVDKIKICTFMDRRTLQKDGSTSFNATSGNALTLTRGFTIRQGYLEQGNVNAVQEMVDMMQVMRAYEANQKMLQTQDQVLRKAANELGKVR